MKKKSFEVNQKSQDMAWDFSLEENEIFDKCVPEKAVGAEGRLPKSKRKKKPSPPCLSSNLKSSQRTAFGKGH